MKKITYLRRMEAILFVVVLVILYGLFEQTAEAGKQISVTVGIVNYLNTEFPNTFSQRVEELQDRITNLLNNPKLPDVDLIFEPEWILVESSSSINDPSIVEIIEDGNGNFIVRDIDNPIGSNPESRKVLQHISWLRETATMYNVNFFTNVHERIDIGEQNYIHGTTGLVINHQGKIIGIKRKNNFPEDLRDEIVGPTIRSFSLLNQQGEEFVVLPLICGDLSTTEPYKTWYITKLKENNSKIADIVIHPNAHGDYDLYQLFLDIQAGVFNPDNPDDWFWNGTIEDVLIQEYMAELLVRSNNSYYFASDKYGSRDKNLTGFKLVSFPPGPEAFSDENYIEGNDYLVIKVYLERSTIRNKKPPPPVKPVIQR